MIKLHPQVYRIARVRTVVCLVCGVGLCFCDRRAEVEVPRHACGVELYMCIGTPVECRWIRVVTLPGVSNEPTKNRLIVQQATRKG